jgi:toxin secretion/phage lysis holin
MKYLTEFWTWIIAGSGSMVAFVTGHTSEGFQFLLALMVIDIISGLMKGIQKKRLRSSIMSLGIMKKGGILLSVAFGYVLDMAINDGQPVFSIMMTWLAIGNEGLSIAENLTALGVKVPRVVKDKLGQFADEAVDLQHEKDKK